MYREKEGQKDVQTGRNGGEELRGTKKDRGRERSRFRKGLRVRVR